MRPANWDIDILDPQQSLLAATAILVVPPTRAQHPHRSFSEGFPTFDVAPGLSAQPHLPYTRRERPSSRSRGSTLPDVSSILTPSSSHLASPSRASFTHSPVQTHFPLRNASFDEDFMKKESKDICYVRYLVSFKDLAMRTGAGESSGETEDSTSDHSEISPQVGTHIRPAPARVYSDPAVGRYDTRRHSYPSPIDSLLPSDPISRRTSPRRGSLLGQSRQEDYQT
ncbi:hypothetical protein FA15DRAFT_710119 [Coprinopsis marcescibilis]|uniref:Uncharacterized protein n=1 Tax=Coprinopsis marcescibilis TaxID=230819 RepID=A0A5C3KDJ4_COPMA|nr:hypothetical protein FA15DRAFT_710119 [Coprinopsis marcescibilis]